MGAGFIGFVIAGIFVAVNKVVLLVSSGWQQQPAVLHSSMD
jgi:hypothetical protein